MTYWLAHADFEFDDVEVFNNRPMNIWLAAKNRDYVALDDESPGRGDGQLCLMSERAPDHGRFTGIRPPQGTACSACG